ncbi:TetR/AcrR family transcriptional regulator [Frankia sp. AgB1.9]|nr:TetR/AcrR family transcriptional regulator [Frankia sp. AgB1.9]MBL7618494.1 TetR/AcrR family transcriptional regulator [Frankia sp. AgB1.8]
MIREILTVGYSRLRVEAIATRAGVHKTTIYRRWPTREALVTDALRDQAVAAIAIPDGGSVRTDLLHLARSVALNMRSPVGGGLLRTFISESASVPEIAGVARDFWTTRFSVAGEVVTRAVARGELPAGTDPNRLLEALVAPLFLRTFVLMESINDRDLTLQVDVVLRAARTDCYVTSPTGPKRASTPGS